MKSWPVTLQVYNNFEGRSGDDVHIENENIWFQNHQHSDKMWFFVLSYFYNSIASGIGAKPRRTRFYTKLNRTDLSWSWYMFDCVFTHWIYQCVKIIYYVKKKFKLHANLLKIWCFLTMAHCLKTSSTSSILEIKTN